mmetsp:Transcript_80939/g.225256  ORF Transcript_80939/g.225256 Transcript_80939/m.225256 type:complete len:234 (+) Transcript_80939:543-1244(+)
MHETTPGWRSPAKAPTTSAAGGGRLVPAIASADTASASSSSRARSCAQTPSSKSSTTGCLQRSERPLPPQHGPRTGFKHATGAGKSSIASTTGREGRTPCAHKRPTSSSSPRTTMGFQTSQPRLSPIPSVFPLADAAAKRRRRAAATTGDESASATAWTAASTATRSGTIPYSHKRSANGTPSSAAARGSQTFSQVKSVPTSPRPYFLAEARSNNSSRSKRRKPPAPPPPALG